MGSVILLTVRLPKCTVNSELIMLKAPNIWIGASLAQHALYAP